MDIILYVVAILGMIGAFIPLHDTQTWWLRAWTYPRIQMACLNVIILIAFIWGVGLTTIWAGGIIAGLVLAIAYCISSILPFTRFGQIESPTLAPTEVSVKVKFLVGNVLMDNEDSAGLMQSVRDKDPDIVFLVETNSDWRDYMSELETIYPHTYLLPLEKYNGMLFYSKFEILSSEVRYLVQDYIPSLTLDLDVKGTRMRFFGVHPRPPRPEDATEDMDQELEIIAREALANDGPVVVTGDLNDVGWSRTTKNFLRDSHLLDPRQGRGLFNTFNAKYPFARWPLDHLFHSDHFGLIAMERLPKFGSDHFPICVTLGLRDQD